MRTAHPALSLMAGALAAAAAGTALGAEPEGHEDVLLGSIRQLTFDGQRAGEGYFSADGTKMIFQSEREPDNPFYQIYLMDLATGDTRRVSPGSGQTTCAWIHPDGKQVLFASTHLDPETRAKQDEEFKKRAEGKGRRYAWSFDSHYDIFQSNLDGGELVNLTDALGYDAEGSYSPNGSQILFASNRHAYEDALSPEDQALLERDASYFMELYVMNADGSDVRRLTDSPGYDGGPFFSADGEQIVWRRFSEDGATAEIMTMHRDGSGARALTRLGAMSWAPFFHPSGDYVIFATSVHGFDNFELYLVDAAGEQAPVRVTATAGFDGLPVFTPDGKRLAWSTSRTADKKPQIFMADWNDAEARKLLGLAAVAAPDPNALPVLPATSAAIDGSDLRRHVEVLASEAMEGRLTGSPGERRATAYVAEVFKRLGLEPAGDEGGYFQAFNFTAGVRLGSGNTLTFEGSDLAPVVDQDWRPLGMSSENAVPPAPIAFAGYGIVAPAGDGQPAYDSYGELDVQGKWAMVLRHLPEDVTPAMRQHLHRYADLGYKAAVARERGAIGLIVVSGPQARVQSELVPLGFDAASAGSQLGAISLANRPAGALLATVGKDLAQLQSELDQGTEVPGFDIPDIKLGATIDLEQEIREGRNVLARLQASDGSTGSAVVIGAHIDHLGYGVEGKSLARSEEQGQIHYGADDNASGVAALLEIAEYLADLKASGQFRPPRDVMFAAWSGEELGLLGSTHFVERFAGSGQASLQPMIAAYLNMDMIGHYDKGVVLQGVGSSSIWPREIEQRNVPVGLSITTNDNAFLPTDTTAFYLKGVPVLNAFTGPATTYHTPRDVPAGLNYQGAAKIAQLMALITRSVAIAEAAPDYVKQTPADQAGRRRTSSIYLGTIPDYANSDVTGALISGVAEGGPAAAAGMAAGDQVIRIAGREIANIYDYSHALDGLKIGEPVEMVVLRDGQEVTLTVVPKARE
jgi:Tol biopolymer transport system component